jgi:glycosyltransferase involved in cell wall biosynthesis
MRILIDLQGAQTESRFRGIGRYSVALAQAMARNAGTHEIWLVLNGRFPETIEPIRIEFDALIPQERIRVFELPGTLAEIDPRNGGRARAAELIREAFIANLKPDVVHVMSLFEGFIDDASVSIGAFDQTVPTAVTLYDLIPLLREKSSFANELHRTWYFRKLLSLKRADLLLAISESSRREGIAGLKLGEDKVVNISAAIDDCFRPIEFFPEERQSFLLRFGIPDSFILYMGGSDERKNLDRLIRAYARLPKELRDRYALVLAGRMPSEGLKVVAQECGLSSESLIFTGFVTDEDLARLYNLCKLFVFPSLHEGFGLPPLEAMACGAVTIGSNRTSIPEVIGRADALFDPEDTDSMVAAISRGLTDVRFREEMRSHGPAQAKRFSWDESAKTALSALEVLYKKNTFATPRTPANCRYRLAYVSPLPPEKSGISDYSAELLPELARYYDIDVISDLPEITDSWMQANFSKRSVAWFTENAGCYDRILYQIGNSPFHAHMFELLERHPGAVTLHDFFLSTVKHWMAVTGEAPGGGVQSLFALPQGYGAIRHSHQEGLDAAKMVYPCNADVFQNARGIVVHSPQNITSAQRWFGDDVTQDMRMIPLLRHLPLAPSGRKAARARLGVAENDFVVCSFGLMDPSKLSHRLLQV